MRTGLAAFIFLAGICLGSAASAGKLDKSAETSIQKLLDIVAPAGDRSGAIHFGELPPGGVMRFVFQGDQHHEYYFNGACDGDCTDLNLAVLDAAGAEVKVDDADDAAPVVRVIAAEFDDDAKPSPRPLTVEVRMVGCKKEICSYGVAITRTE